jgi:hypothetical protein
MSPLQPNLSRVRLPRLQGTTARDLLAYHDAMIDWIITTQALPREEQLWLRIDAGEIRRRVQRWQRHYRDLVAEITEARETPPEWSMPPS